MKLMQFSPGLEGARMRISVNMQDIFQGRFLYQNLVRKFLFLEWISAF
jgi:hypothetical protein